MTDPIIRRENVIREKRIAVLSDVLSLKHKHKEYFEMVGGYDSLLKKFDELGNHIRSARKVRSALETVPKRTRELRLADTRLRDLLSAALNRISPNYYVSMGGKARAEKAKTGRNYSWNFNVGWTWNFKVFNELYDRCKYDYGFYIILSADKVRVNHKWVDLFEVKVFHVNTGLTTSGYVARTKTPKRNAVLNLKASNAVHEAEQMMIGEMKTELNIGANDD